MRTILLLGTLLLSLTACDSGGTSSVSVRYEVDNASEVAYTDDNGSRQTSTSSAWSTTINASSETALALTATSSNGQPVTASIFVDDKLVRSRRGSSVHVELTASSSSSGGSSSSELEVRGPIEAITLTQVTVLGRVFQISSGTRLLNDDNATVSLAAFVVGGYVEVEGRANSDGTYQATKLKLEDNSDGSSGTEIEIHAAITAIDALSITVGGRRFVTSPTTRYLDDRGNAVLRTSFQVGEFVEAEGHAQADGSVQAKKIKRDDD
jgi:hypothetical protein